MARKIFISYRRQDHPEFVERIRDWFIHKYGRANVFMDFDSIPPGVRFADFIRKEVEQCDAVLAIIGSSWLELLREKIINFDDEDYVKIEISLALQLGKPIFPICILDAKVPNKSELPPELRSLLDYNATFLHSGRDFLDNIERLLEAVERQTTQEVNTLVDAEPPRELTETERKLAELAEQMSPLSAEDYSARGSLRRMAGNYKGADDDFTEAIRIAPNDESILFQYHYGRAQIRLRTGDLNGALADFTELIRLYPNDPDNKDGYKMRGETRYKMGDMVGAVADYSEAIHLDPEYADAYEGRGEAYFVLEQYQLALADFERSDELFSTSKTLAGIAIANWKLGYKREAIDTWFEVVDNVSYG